MEPNHDIHHRSKTDIVIDLSSIGHFLFDLISTIYTFTAEHMTAHYRNRCTKYAYIMHILKLTFSLYLILGLYSILSGLKEGLLRAVKPLTTTWSVLRWLVATG
jgi:uncharacterized membrane protein YkgB